MGNFYTNYTLRGPSQKDVVAALAGRSAFVTPEQNGCIVVFDEESDEQDVGIIQALASCLACELQCPVLAILNHDDDILWYLLYLEGTIVDNYDSAPGYFDSDAEPSAPEGGDSRKLCDAFGSKNVAEVERVLHKSSFDEDGYMFAVMRHADLATALGLPSFGIGIGYNYIANGELPVGLDEKDMVKVK